mmetsp:Transcript_7091/g.26089  ORF Transcript_7091/g.26089 Transcript_7091/m.26089 type:complete len:558 (+) Transcript_7091:193-1866(+)
MAVWLEQLLLLCTLRLPSAFSQWLNSLPIITDDLRDQLHLNSYGNAFDYDLPDTHADGEELPKLYVYKLEELGDLLQNHWRALNDDSMYDHELTQQRAYGPQLPQLTENFLQTLVDQNNHSSGSMGKSHGAWNHRLYLEQLAERQHRAFRNEPDRSESQSEARSYEVGVEVFETEQHALGSILTYRALLSKQLTDDPNEAQLFLVPHYHREYKLRSCSYWKHHVGCEEWLGKFLNLGDGEALLAALRMVRDRRGVPFVDRFNGTDHVLPLSRHGMLHDVTVDVALSLEAPLRNFMKLGVEGLEVVPLWHGDNRKRFGKCCNIYSVPYPSSVHLSVRLAQAAAGGGSSASAVLDHFLTPWRSAVHRPRKHNYTIFSNIHGKDHAPALRSELMAQCERRRGCLRLARPASDPSGHPLGKEEAFERHARHILEAYGSSTFCLNPHGDTASRKAIFDALLMGCIPVLFHPAQKALYGWYHFDQLVVYFDFRRVLQGEDVFRFLDTVDVAPIQESIRRWGHQLQYSLHDLTHLRLLDAFDVAMLHCWRMARQAQLLFAAATG